MGYYSAKIELLPDETDRDTLIVRILADKPVIIRKFKLTLQGDALNDRAFDRLIKKIPLKEGEVLHHGKYEDIKTSLRNRALARGYFDAEMVTSRIRVYPKEYAADIEINFSTGHRYKFGEIRIEGIYQS